ncbi:penicillin-binding protein 1A [Haliangium sp.]|uniref:penicillin-binding protein 1A n=1 Tax=Haliangium sp. TaxID=2663208 RepID=UPI003D14FACF
MTKSAKARPRPILRAIKWVLLAGLVAAALGAVCAAAVLWHFGSDPDLPRIRTVGDYQPKQVTRITDRDGAVIGELYVERRTYAPYDQIPELLVHAFVAAEDAEFFEHAGLDYLGMLRAAFINLKTGETRQGASTITQQVVKTFLLSAERTYRRKLQEIILARRLEQALSKEDILALYLNQIYFGHGRYGVVEAARYYFGKNLDELHAGEAAMLAGLVQSPENISPKKVANRERAKRRQQYVLEQMVHRGYLDEAEARKWVNEPIRIIEDPFPAMGTAPEWVGIARNALVERYGEDRLPTLGARVRTTLDRDIQAAAVEALRAGLDDFDRRRNYGHPVRSVKPDKIDLEVAKLARRLRKRGPMPGEQYLAVIREVHPDDGELVVDLGDWQAAVAVDDEASPRTNPNGKPIGERFSPGDVIRVQVPRATKSDSRPKHAQRVVSLARGPQAAVVVCDPATGEVLALVGGYDLDVADFDRATQARRQPGSTFKPFVYAAALASGRYTAASIVNDAPEVYNLWKPQNYKKGAFEGPVRLRYALAKSINTVSIRVLSDIGPETVVDLARRMGIQSELPAQLSLALGSGEVSPLELTSAFATLAAGGAANPPRFIQDIDVAGDDDAPAAPPAEQVLTPEVAYVVLDMMTSVINEGTGGAARSLNMPIAGKTGTSNDARDAWFIGLTPHYAVGVWVGFDDNQPLGRGEGGGKSALPIYIELMKRIGAGERSARWTVPEGVSQVLIDKATGLLASEGAPADSAYTEVFVAGTEPREYAPAPDQAAASSVFTDEYEDEAGVFDDAYDDDDSP